MGDVVKVGIDMSNPEFFKYWSELAAKDPERFEREKKKVMEEVTSGASPARQKYLLELEATWAFIYAERGFFAALRDWNGIDPTDTSPPTEAQVLPFPKK